VAAGLLLAAQPPRALAVSAGAITLSVYAALAARESILLDGIPDAPKGRPLSVLGIARAERSTWLLLGAYLAALLWFGATAPSAPPP
jgi:hypothetical protein